MIQFNCPTCGHGLRVKTELAGKKGKCLKCGQAVVVPAQAASRVPGGDAANLLDEKTRAPRDAPAPNILDAATIPPPSSRTVAPTSKDNTSLDVDAGEDRSLTDFLAPAQQPDEIGRLGMYRILKVLGAGGMGVVYKAEDPGLKRLVAIKAMLPAIAASASAKKRFLREAQAAAAIRHNNIVTIFQVGEDRGIPFLAMEFLEGESLDDRLKREATLPLADVLRIGREMAEGMAAAHERGLIHRDIKPANTWLEASPGRKASPGGTASPGRKSGEIHVKILDFGLARSTDDQAHLTQSGSIIGTPAYMAPEQGRGETLDARCDLWSLGVVLYRMCTGELPFKGADTVSTLMAVAMNNPSPPAQMNADIPAGLSQLVMKLLKKEPAKRIASAQEVADNLRQLEQGQQQETRVTSSPAKTGRTQRQDAAEPTAKAPRQSKKDQGKSRTPMLLALAGGLVTLVVAGAVIFWAATRDTRGNNDPAEKTGSQAKAAPEPQTEPKEEKKDLIGPPPPPLPESLTVSIAQTFHQGHYTTVKGATAPAAVKGVSVSGDGKYVLTGSSDKMATLWDAASGKKRQTFLGHTSFVYGAVLSSDGKRVLTGSADKSAILWDAFSGTKLHIFHGHTLSVMSVAMSGDGKLVLTGSNDKTAILWDVASGTRRHTFDWHTAAVTTVALSADGKLAVTGSGDKTAILWDAVSGKKLQTLQGHTSTVTSVTLSADGKQVVTGSVDKTAILWDAASGQKLRTFLGHNSSVHGVALRGDGRLLVTGSYDKTAILWDTVSGKNLQTIQGHTDKIYAVALSGDGRLVVTGAADGTAMLWEVKGSSMSQPPPPPQPPPPTPVTLSGTMVQRYQGHNGPVRGVALSRDGDYVVTASWDNRAIVWEAASGKKIQTFSAHTAPVWSVAMTNDGRQVLSGSDDKRAYLWEASTGKILQSFVGHIDKVLAVSLSGDGKLALTGSWDKTAILWDAVSGIRLQTFLGHTDRVYGVALSSDARYVLTGSGDNTAILWDAASGKKIQSFLGHANFVMGVALSSDARYVLTASSDRTAALWNAATGAKIQTFLGHGNIVTSVVVSGDGKYVVTGSEDRSAILWTVSGKKLQTFQGHTGWVGSVALSGDSKHVLTGSGDKSAILWDVKTSPAREVFNINGTLTQQDFLDPVRKKPCKTYNVNMVAGKTYDIDLVSTQIDSYLRLESPQGLQVAVDDDSGGNLNARIIYACPQSGLYRVYATTYNGGTGSFTLSVSER